MVKLLTVAAVSGVWFVAWQLYRRGRGQQSLENHQRHKDARPGDRVTLQDYYFAKEAVAGPSQRFLNVNNFGIAELEVGAQTHSLVGEILTLRKSCWLEDKAPAYYMTSAIVALDSVCAGQARTKKQLGGGVHTLATLDCTTFQLRLPPAKVSWCRATSIRDGAGEDRGSAVTASC